MMGKRYVFCLFSVILFSLVGPVTTNEENQTVVSQSEMTEYHPAFSDFFQLAVSQHTGAYFFSSKVGPWMNRNLKQDHHTSL